jgi:Na+-driven multidrug efflux pump
VIIPLGVTGAAIATILSQFGAGIGSVIFLVKKYELIKLKKDDLKIRKNLIIKLCVMSIPMALQYSITAIGSLFLQTAINSLGSDCVAAFTVGEKVWGFGWSAINCIGVGLAGFCGQNIGAGKLYRVKKGVSSCTVLVFGISIILTCVFFIFGKDISKLFLELPTETILENVNTYYKLQSPFLAVLAMIGVYRNAIMGMGYSLQGMLAGIFELVGRTSVSLIFVAKFGFAACCIASPIAWILADILLIPMYFHIVKKLSNQHPDWLVNE